MPSAGLPSGRVPAMVRHRSALIVAILAENKRVGMCRRYYAGQTGPIARNSLNPWVVDEFLPYGHVFGETRGQVHHNNTAPPPIAITEPMRSPQT